MVLPLGKLAIILGAGLVGSVLVKEGRLPRISNFLSRASKVLKRIRHDEKPASKPKPLTDAFSAQVNSLRQELQVLASNRPVTIVTSNSSGGIKYGVIVIVVVVGYGYVWWKGWKLADMMFATKRSLSDASIAVAKQLETVYASLAATKRHLSSRMDRVDCSLAVVEKTTNTTKEEDETNLGVERLIHSISMETQGMYLPPVQTEELQASPSMSPKAKRSLETVGSASGLKVLRDVPEEARNTSRASNRLNITQEGSSNSCVKVEHFLVSVPVSQVAVLQIDNNDERLFSIY